MIKVHVVIKIKASSDSPQKLRGNVYIIKQRAVLVPLSIVDSGYNYFYWDFLRRSFISARLCLFGLVWHPIFFFLPLWVMFFSIGELVVTNQVNVLGSTLLHQIYPIKLRIFLWLIFISLRTTTNRPNGTVFQTPHPEQTLLGGSLTRHITVRPNSKTPASLLCIPVTTTTWLSGGKMCTDWWS